MKSQGLRLDSSQGGSEFSVFLFSHARYKNDIKINRISNETSNNVRTHLSTYWSHYSILRTPPSCVLFFFFFCFFFSFRSAEKIKSCVIILWVPDSSFHFFLLHDDRFFLCDSLRNKSYFYSAGKSDSRDRGSYGPIFIINHLRGG